MYPAMEVEQYPGLMDTHRVDRIIFNFNRLFKYLLGLLDDTELLILHDICELLLEVLLSRHQREKQTPVNHL
jgi:hypothetical protein